MRNYPTLQVTDAASIQSMIIIIIYIIHVCIDFDGVAMCERLYYYAIFILLIIYIIIYIYTYDVCLAECVSVSAAPKNGWRSQITRRDVFFCFLHGTFRMKWYLSKIAEHILFWARMAIQMWCMFSVLFHSYIQSSNAEQQFVKIVWWCNNDFAFESQFNLIVAAVIYI